MWTGRQSQHGSLDGSLDGSLGGSRDQDQRWSPVESLHTSLVLSHDQLSSITSILSLR